MLSYDGRLHELRRPGRVPGMSLGACLLMALVLAGCADGSGFRPMYAQSPQGSRLSEKLATVETTTIPGRVGQRIRNELIFQHTVGGTAAPTVYRLDISIREAIGSTLVKTTGEAVSQVYNLDATFTLIDMRTKKVLLTGVSYARASFDRNLSVYSNVRARDDAENRAAKTIADDLKSRLSAFLSNDKV